ncbi:MAG TPA: hypothetical protein VNX68_18770 [Nitrosopumilaceae archaeon]|jgi:hypothetical protein|nr:hypothetical protein [Nitrosopumilaceae archaeon]
MSGVPNNLPVTITGKLAITIANALGYYALGGTPNKTDCRAWEEELLREIAKALGKPEDYFAKLAEECNSWQEFQKQLNEALPLPKPDVGFV